MDRYVIRKCRYEHFKLNSLNKHRHKFRCGEEKTSRRSTSGTREEIKRKLLITLP